MTAENLSASVTELDGRLSTVASLELAEHAAMADNTASLRARAAAVVARARQELEVRG